MIDAAILQPDASREFYTDEGCYILESSNSDADPEVSIARARVRPGVTTKSHRLDGSVERYLIISGQGLVEIGDTPPTAVNPGDIVVIPDGVSQRITNTGTFDLVFYCVCAPRFSRDMYVSLEDD